MEPLRLFALCLALAAFCSGDEPVISDALDSDDQTPEDLKADDFKSDVEKSDALKASGQTRARVSYEGAQILSVVAPSKKSKRTILKLEDLGILETWSGIVQNDSKIDVFVKADALLKVKQFFDSKKIVYEIINDNIQYAIAEDEKKVADEDIEELVGKNGHQLTWNFYHSLDEINSFVDYMAAAHARCTIETIGSSVEGRPLRVVKIAAGRPNLPAVWIDGGMHAREWITPAAVTYVINELIENRTSLDPAINGVDFYLMPIVNPDGYEYSRRYDRLWRKNRRDSPGRCAGVDLNRNFAYQWGNVGASDKPCKATYAGSSAFSEPETLAISQFVTHKPVKGYLSFHSYGQFVLYPWAHERSPPTDYRELRKVGRSMARAMRSVANSTYLVGQTYSSLYPASGSAEDWAKGAANIKYTYTVELRDKGAFGFVLPSIQIIPTGQEALAAVVELAKAVNAP